VLIDGKPAHYALWQCDVCKNKIHDNAQGVWHCNSCSFDICVACLPRPAPYRLCASQCDDALLVQGMPAYYSVWNCDIGHHTIPSESHNVWHCASCQYDVCSACQPTPSDKRLCSRQHTGLLVNGQPANYERWVCDHCSRKIPADTHGVWHCSECQFDLCPACQPVPSPHRLCSQRHDTGVLIKHKPSYYGPVWGCDGCSREFSRQHQQQQQPMMVWHCQECSFDLCSACQRNPPRR
jgi:ribosomal protein L37AE/L43A